MKELSNKINDIANKLDDFNEDDILQDFFDKNSERVEELNKKRLGKGEYTDGSSLRDYSEASIEAYFKPTVDNPYLEGGGDSIRLYNEGETYDNITSEYVFEEGLYVYLKEDEFGLEQEYGDEILGLNNEDVKSLQKDVKKAFEQFFSDLKQDLL